MIEIYKQVAEELFRIFDGDSPLHFPKYFNNDIKEFRISEQESKIIFSNIFLSNKTPFAVEAPTKSKHNFTGEIPKSARYDLVTYEYVLTAGKIAFKTKFVIELKAHNPEEEQIRKDIEKFACSDLDCIWFHTLAKADNNTYKTLLKKINNAIENEKEKIVGSHKWDFVIAVLETKELYAFSETISKEQIFSLENINSFAKLI